MVRLRSPQAPRPYANAGLETRHYTGSRCRAEARRYVSTGLSRQCPDGPVEPPGCKERTKRRERPAGTTEFTMPGFPTLDVGTPINRGKARRYAREEKRHSGEWHSREGSGSVEF